MMPALLQLKAMESPDSNVKESPISRVRSAVKRALGQKETANQIALQRNPIKEAIERAKHPQRQLKTGFSKTWIPELDELLVDGIPLGASVLITGGPGAGKTVLSLQMAYESAKAGEKVLYLSFEESEQRLMQYMKSFGWDPDSLVEKGLLQIKRVLPADVKRSIDVLIAKSKGELLIEAPPIINLPANIKPNKIFIDSVTAIASAFVETEEIYHMYIEQLFGFLHSIYATSFIMTEKETLPLKQHQTANVEELLADGVIILYNLRKGPIRESAIEVLRMRGAEHKKKVVAMRITDHGIDIYPDQEIFWELS